MNINRYPFSFYLSKIKRIKTLKNVSESTYSIPLNIL